jgi:shikimate kinase
MRGLGRSSAAVSVVNALPTGVGCAIGVRLYAAASLELEPSGAPGEHIEPPGSRTPLVSVSLERALATVAPGRGFSARLEIESEIPVAKGLKSSSAVATAIVRAVYDAFGERATDREVASLAAQVGRAVGVSATGAFDDAMAGLVPGFVVTDNRSDRVLLRAPVDPDWVAVVHIPAGNHRPSPDLRERFQRHAGEGSVAADAALRGDWAEAMRQNSTLVERVMGYDYASLRQQLAAAGAISAGVSGMGPSLVALAPKSRAPEVLAVMPADRFVVPLCSEVHP